jgi:hypothetical protein
VRVGWDQTLQEYILDWDDVRAAADPHANAVEFLRSAFHHACRKSGWSAELAATEEGTPPPSGDRATGRLGRRDHDLAVVRHQLARGEFGHQAVRRLRIGHSCRV